MRKHHPILSMLFALCLGITVVASCSKEETISDKDDASIAEAVDLGLSVKWASWNMGATKPEGYGNYYAWGEIEVKSKYSWSTYKYCNGTRDTMTKYCIDNTCGEVDGKTVLQPVDDVANAKWGDGWRLPTSAEIKVLEDSCVWAWTSVNGVDGYKVTGPNSNWIFLPAAGFRGGKDIFYNGECGYYWSSSISSSDSRAAVDLGFKDIHSRYNIERYIGLTVRPVYVNEN